MGNSGMQTDAALMEATARRFEDEANQMESNLSSLKGKAESARAGWQGEGSVQFQLAIERWASDQKKIDQLLMETSGLIRNAAHGYTGADQSAAQSMKSQGGNTSLPL